MLETTFSQLCRVSEVIDTSVIEIVIFLLLLVSKLVSVSTDTNFQVISIEIKILVSPSTIGKILTLNILIIAIQRDKIRQNMIKAHTKTIS